MAKVFPSGVRLVFSHVMCRQPISAVLSPFCHSLVTQVDPAGQGEDGFLKSESVARVGAVSCPALPPQPSWLHLDLT